MPLGRAFSKRKVGVVATVRFRSEVSQTMQTVPTNRNRNMRLLGWMSGTSLQSPALKVEIIEVVDSAGIV